MTALMARIRRLASLCVAATPVVLLVACSGSSKTPSAAPTTPLTSGSVSQIASTPATPAKSAVASSTAKGGESADIDVCALATAAQISSLAGFPVKDGVRGTLAPGQDQCKYGSDSGIGVTVIVYAPNSGVTWKVLTDDSGADTAVSGVGDKAATDGAVETDVQTGDRLVAVQSGSDTARVAVAKAVIAALH